MLPLIFLLPKSRAFGAAVMQVMPCERGELEIRRVPDSETYIRFQTPVQGRDVVLVCSLDSPDDKVVQLYLAASIAREYGAKSVGLIVPYLPYLRQDGELHEGEAVTSKHFAALLSRCCDWLVTVDPHLNRARRLNELYPAPIGVAHAAPAIATWITINVERPMLIAPNEENASWVAEVAELARCPYHVLKEERHGGTEAHLPLMDATPGAELQPVILDNLVSSGEAMLNAIRLLQQQDAKPAICIAVHPLLAGESYAALLTSGIDKLVSCNTIAHPTNRINVAPAVAAKALTFLKPMLGNETLHQRECVRSS